MTSINIKIFVAISGIFIGCALNMVFLELLVRTEPGIGTLVTFLQFLFISIHGFVFTAKFGSEKPKVAIIDYVLLVVMFFVANVCNNMAFNYNIPVPLHIIFRTGSLIANMIMGIIILNKKYTYLKYVSVFMISVGIVISTIESSDLKQTKCVNCELKLDNNVQKEYVSGWIVGVTLLTIALLVSARMGIYQEWLAKHYGKYPEESLFYVHLLPLPGFIFFYSTIYKHIVIATTSTSIQIPILRLYVPELWLYLAGNVFTQYLCISSVYVLTTECTSLTVTLVITLRKFLSLLVSIIYFKNPFTIIHWIGTFLVFAGTILFTEILQKIKIFTKTETDVKRNSESNTNLI